jgi:hypothetical protein
VSIDALQKASLTVLAWFVGFIYTKSKVIGIVWPPQRRIAAILAGHYPIDASPPLPLWAWITIYATPTAIIAILVIVYRNRDARIA